MAIGAENLITLMLSFQAERGKKGLLAMRTHVGSQYGRHVIMHMQKGEGILECVEQECGRLSIKNAIVTSGIGSLRKVCYHRIATVADDPTNEYITIEGPIEMSALQGVIVDGEPHLHITCCDREHAFGGHLENGCEVQYLAEISVMELLDANLTRRLDAFGISYIDQR